MELKENIHKALDNIEVMLRECKEEKAEVELKKLFLILELNKKKDWIDTIQQSYINAKNYYGGYKNV